jgi:NADH-quinone oxidoreductase subunit L
VMTVPLLALALLSLLGGALNLPGAETFARWLEHTLGPAAENGFNLAVAGISTGLALLGVAIAWLIYRRPALKADDPLRPALGIVFRGMEQKWKVDELYDWLIVRRYTALARFLAGRVDQGFIDGIANGLAAAVKDLSTALRPLQTGYVRTYVLSILLGVVLILGYLILR